MLIVVGLGNPGEEYKNTRHNAGRIMLETLSKKHDFSAWKDDKSIKALLSKGELDGEKMSFVMPNNFMNNSGKSVGPFIKSKKDLAKLVVVYDDLDLPIGRIKLSFNRSSGGHNGLESIIKAVKSQEFLRIRVGISPATSKGLAKKPTGEKVVHDFLLKNFKDSELAELKKLSKKIGEALVCISSESKDKAMSLFN
jgi:PTH1 family peptidyl-tRNA hydrolase